LPVENAVLYSQLASRAVDVELIALGTAEEQERCL